MIKGRHLFTSESVTEGHPDKVADQISDAIVDLFLSKDPEARVACETMTTTNRVVLAGEIRGPGVMDRLLQLGTVVWLAADFDAVYARANRVGGRPMLAGRSPEALLLSPDTSTPRA